jgi:hypothetical protein
MPRQRKISVLQLLTNPSQKIIRRLISAVVVWSFSAASKNFVFYSFFEYMFSLNWSFEIYVLS